MRASFVGLTAGFDKSMEVYGITLVAKSDVPDDFLRAVGETIVELFPAW